MKPVILFPVGGGGRWLANLIHCLHSNEFTIIPSLLNFHDDIWSKTNLINFWHFPHNNAAGPTVEPHNHDSFCSAKSQFISFVNAHTKRWPYYDPFKNLTKMNQFFYLANDARWRMGKDPAFNNLYLSRISLDSDNLFLNPAEFAQQLFDFLSKHNITYFADTNFVLQSVDNFKATCKPADHYGNIQSTGWLAWCHALTLEHNIAIDVNIRDNFNGFIEFVDCNNNQFKSITQEHFLIQV
jgi:hypothetical protein